MKTTVTPLQATVTPVNNGYIVDVSPVSDFSLKDSFLTAINEVRCLQRELANDNENVEIGLGDSVLDGLAKGSDLIGEYVFTSPKDVLTLLDDVLTHNQINLDGKNNVKPN